MLKGLAYDACHKIYVLETAQDVDDADKLGYQLYPIEHLKELYENSCSLRFVNTWDLRKTVIPQGTPDQFIDWTSTPLPTIKECLP